jgi:hypothetical protein
MPPKTASLGDGPVPPVPFREKYPQKKKAVKEELPEKEELSEFRVDGERASLVRHVGFAKFLKHPFEKFWGALPEAEDETMAWPQHVRAKDNVANTCRWLRLIDGKS